jgi:hypothetical protein
MPSVASAANIWTAGLLPVSGDLSAPPGATEGWGYTLANEDPSLWLVPFNLDADAFEHGTPNSLFLFPVVAPGGTIHIDYDGMNGLYEFTWDVTAPVGFVNVGTFVIGADWFTDDPAEGGIFSHAAGDVELPYSVAAARSTTEVPEPGTLVLTLGALAAHAVRRRASTTRTRVRPAP